LNPQRHTPITDRKPEEIIALRAGDEIDVNRFIQHAKSVACKLPDHRYVFNLFSDRYQYLLGFCAAVIAGQCTLMPPNRLTKTLEQLARNYPDSYSLGESDLLNEKANRKSHNPVPVMDYRSEVPLIPIDQLCAIAFTSGSTGSPTPNLKYWETLRTGSGGSAELLLNRVSERLNLLATVPPQHMWGFETSILLPLFANAAISYRTPFYPQDIAEALESLPEPRALISSPVHLNILLKSGVELVKLDRILSATASMSKELAQQLECRFNTQVLEIFGSSESGVLACRNSATETLWQISDLFELDVRKDGVLIQAEHLPGEIVLQDIIEKVGDTRFRWIGRHQDMINIAGKRGSLIDLNRRILAIEGVVDAVVFAPENDADRLAAMVVAPELKSSDILDGLRLEVESVFLPRPVYMVPNLPRQETGKLANRDVIKLFGDMMKTKSSEKQEP